MSHNAAPVARGQADAVARQMWQQQYDQYCQYWMSNYAPQVPWQNPYAQQSTSMYTHPTYAQNQSIPRNTHGAQYGGSSSFGYAAQAAQVPASYQYPLASSTSPYATHQYGHSAPASDSYLPYYQQYYSQDYSQYYYPQYYYPQHYQQDYQQDYPQHYSEHHGTPVPYRRSVAGQSWATQQQYGWQGNNNNSGSQLSRPQNVYGGGRQDNKSDNNAGSHSRGRSVAYPSGPSRGEAPVRDNYRPVYATSAPSRQVTSYTGVHASRQKNIHSALHGYPTRPLVAAKPGPRGKKSRLWIASPLSSYLPLLWPNATQNSEAPTTSASDAHAQEDVPSTLDCTLGALSPVETKLTLASLRSYEAAGTENMEQIHDADNLSSTLLLTLGANLAPEFVKTSTMEMKYLLELDVQIAREMEATTTMEMKHLSELDMQIAREIEATISANTMSEVVTRAHELVQVPTIIGLVQDEAVTGQAELAGIGDRLQLDRTAEREASFVLGNTAYSDTPANSLTDTPAPACLTYEPAEVVYANLKTGNMADTSNESARNDAADSHKLAEVKVAAKLRETATADTLPNASLPSTKIDAESAQTNRKETSEVTADVTTMTFSSNPTLTEPAAQTPSKKRANPRNRQQQNPTAVLDSVRRSELTSSRNEASTALQTSPTSTDSSETSPPPKRAKHKSEPSPVPEQRHSYTRGQRASHLRNQRPFPTRTTHAPPAEAASTSARSPPLLTGAWSTFATIIQNDDDNVMAKAREERERAQSPRVRYMPEIKESYKNQRGEAGVVVHEMRGATAVAEMEAAEEDVVMEDVVMEEEDDGDDSMGGVELGI